MTIYDASFEAIEATRLQVDRPILSADFQQIAGNVNHLYRLATGENLPGGANPIPGHDHGSRGGAPVPLWTCQYIGEPSRNFCNGNEEYIPFCRMLSSYDTGTYLKKAAPAMTVHPSANNNRYRIWVGGNVSAALQGYQYLTLGGSGNSGRYVFKDAIYNSEAGATLIPLYGAFEETPSGGTAVNAYALRGSPEILLYVPGWAQKLTILVPATCTLSASLYDGEKYFNPGNGGVANWLFRMRIVCGEFSGPWENVAIRNFVAPTWRALTFDCSAIEEEGIQEFRIQLEFNEDLFFLLPTTLGPEDGALWFRGENDAPRASIPAVFSRNV